MSGTTLPYGDRPITRTAPDGGYATPEFLQYLERLSRSHTTGTVNAAQTDVHVSAHDLSISTLDREVAQLNTTVTRLARSSAQTVNMVSLMAARLPIWAVTDPVAAVALVPDTPATIVEQIKLLGPHLLVATLYLTGPGAVTVARISTGPAANVIETATGAFATGWFGGASPGDLGADLSIGLVQVVDITVLGTELGSAFLNVQASFAGEVSAYGSLISWPVGG